MKFGGTSVNGPERMNTIADLAEAALKEGRVCLVASALAGVTNLLVQAAEGAAKGEDPEGPLSTFRARHEELARSLGLEQRCGEALEALGADLAKLLRGISLLQECSPGVTALLYSFGERASCALLAELLRQRGLPARLLDPRDLVLCAGDPLEATPQLEGIRERFGPLRDGGDRLVLLPGFFGGDASGKVVLLGRGGSDFSAALAASALDAALLEIWTDVDGIYSADPRIVPEAFPLPELSFEEAMELAHFGAKVLHPKTIAPAREKGIPVSIRDSFRPQLPGSLVTAKAGDPPQGVRGLSWLPGLALVDLRGPGMPGVPGVAARAFGALARQEISVVLITQGSSEVSICIVVKESDGERAAQALQEAFRAELAAGMVEKVELRPGLGILSAVGDGMRTRVGMAAAFTSAMADAGCNIIAIAQGSGERNISLVLSGEDGPRGLRAAHRRCFGTRETLELYLFGVGLVGSKLLELLDRQIPELAAAGLDLRLCGVANSRRMVLEEAGIAPGEARARLQASEEPSSLERLRSSIGVRRPEVAVFVDCSASPVLAEATPGIIAAGLHAVSANKKANAGSLALYRAIREASARSRRRFYYETHVGAGLPVIDTVKGLMAAGDRLLRFEGVLSGSLSYILGRLGEGVLLSDAVKDAMQKGFTEPDPRDDLSGADVARKVLILAREAGMMLEPSDVKLEGLLPADFDDSGSVDSFVARLPQLDEPFRKRVEALRAQGKVLRYAGSVGPDGARTGLLEAGPDHPLFPIQGGENALSVLTAHYSPRPMVIRGYGAGAEVTAAGVLSDVLRLGLGLR
ncbi:MAG: bifunctional aspartate kinase/homoserine dehydrogenase I [Acidobacteria bacterium]|nr:bifunctional aspartate kinase/homoserine dehydrogenase I [Acidobacteriota bacterium]